MLQLKLENITEIFPKACTCCKKDLKDNKHNSLNLAWKYARIFVLGHYLLLKAQCFPRAYPLGKQFASRIGWCLRASIRPHFRVKWNIFDGITSNLHIMSGGYVALIVLASIFSMALYKIVYVAFSRGIPRISHLSLLFSWLARSPKRSCVYREITSYSWGVSWSYYWKALPAWPEYLISGLQYPIPNSNRLS